LEEKNMGLIVHSDVAQAGAYLEGLPTQGKSYFVKPKSGLDGNSGLSPSAALKTIAAAYAKMTDGAHDICYLVGEGNVSADCTDYQSSTANSAALLWAKNNCHLIGVNSGVSMSPRSRIGFASTFATASNLFKLTGNGCRIENIQFWGGVDGHAQPIGCVEVTGRLNRFQNCHIAGLNGAAGVNDIANAYSLKLTGAIENEFHNCVIGSSSTAIGAGTTTSQIRFATLAQENLFKNCKIVMQSSHQTNHIFLRAPAGSAVVWNMFEDCQFINTGTGLTYATLVTSDVGGVVLLAGKTALYGATDWNSADTGTIVALPTTFAAGDYGFALAVTR
jgi:hypothetical protein